MNTPILQSVRQRITTIYRTSEIGKNVLKYLIYPYFNFPFKEDKHCLQAGIQYGIRQYIFFILDDFVSK